MTTVTHATEANVWQNIQLSDKAMTRWFKQLGMACQMHGLHPDLAEAAEEFAIPAAGGGLELFAKVGDHGVGLSVKASDWRYSNGCH